jgi:hypothetical protein
MNKQVNLPDVADSPTLKDILAASGAPLNKPEARPTVVDVKALETELDAGDAIQALDQRIEATMNLMRLCAVQRGNEDYISGDGAEFRVLMQSCDRVVGGTGFVSRGFGDPVRVARAAAVSEALAKVAAVAAKQGEVS